MWKVRPYQPGDRAVIVTLASRLLEGAAPWRDPGRWLTAVRGWATHSIETSADDDHALLVAVGSGHVAGFVSVSIRKHFTGDLDAYIGELVVSATAEGQGAGRALLEAAEGWAKRHGHKRITLETGARNARARTFYTSAGYAEEDVRLTKSVQGDTAGQESTCRCVTAARGA